MVSISRSVVRWNIIRVVIALVGLVLAAAGVSAGSGIGIQGAGQRLLVELPGWVLMLLVTLLGCATLFILFLIAPRPRRRRKKEEEPLELYVEPVKMTPGTILLLFLLVLAPLAGGISLLWYGLSVYPHASVGETTRASGETASPIAEAPTVGAPLRSAVHSPWVSGILQTLVLAAALTAVGIVIWLYIGVRPFGRGRVPLPLVYSALATAVDDSLEDIRREPDARRAIVRCYRRFEIALATADIRRAPWETVVEFMETALEHPRLPKNKVQDLIHLLEIARFSLHEVGDGERKMAWEALLSIRAALRGEGTDASPP
ncbi:MAG: DUF4129 domain-containing protein [Proteobacteria bacterium]|nr:DUF4129 domain-containing protein [Pseudomonadota bacterium]